MRRLLPAAIIVCLLAVLASAFATDALAKRAPDHANVVAIAPDEVDPSTAYSDMRVNDRTGFPVALYRVNQTVPLGTPEAMARSFLRDRRTGLGLDRADLSDLRLQSTRVAPEATVVRLDQYVGEVPVYEGEVTVTLFGDQVVFVMNGYEPGIDVDTTPVISEAAAHDMARSYIGLEGAVNFEETTLVVYAKRGDQRLAYRTVIIPRLSPIGEWEVLVDAHTGEIFKVVDRSCYVNGTGNTFDADPLSSAHVTYGTTGYTDGNDADTPQLNAELQNKTLLDITFDGLSYQLDGPYAKIVDTEAPFRGLFPQGTNAYPYNRFDDAFEAVNTYYFVDKYMRYINETLLVSCMPYQYSGGVHYDPHGFNGADNSHYTSGNGTLAFGEGGVDDDEDSDVIIHELGHGIHDWLTGGHLSQVNGLSEGTGDYVAASYSRSLGQWSSGDAQNQWVFSWDGHNPFWSGRRTDWPNTYPGGLTGQIHTDGQIWSTCLMRIWDIIGQQAIDKAVFVGLSMTGSSTNQQDAANAVVQAALNMGYSGGDVASMVSEMQTTGYIISVIGVDDVSTSAAAIRLHGASPNPFNPMTRISFDLPANGLVRLDVFNASGQHVRTLVDGPRDAGLNVVPFDAAGLGSGVYFYKMTSGAFSDVRKMTLLK